MPHKRFEEKITKLRRSDRIADLEVERVVDFIQLAQPNGKLLDIGTGSALFAESFFQRGYTVTGVDPDPDMVMASCHYLPQVYFLIAAAEHLPYAAKTFDISFMGMVLHEIQQPVTALTEAERVTRIAVAVLEWPPPKDSDPPPPAPRLAPVDIENMARKVGFSDLEIHPLNKMILYVIHI